MSAPLLAFDIGGTKLAAGVVSPEGDVIAECIAATGDEPIPEQVIEKLFHLSEEALSGAGLALSALAAAGVSFGGPVDYSAGEVITCHHLSGWEGVALREIVGGRTGLPVVIDNDANAAALGETRFGAARGCQHVLYTTVSTGIGAGLVIGGRVHRGANSMAGELGHTHLVPYGPRCTCGRMGCLESVAAGWAIARAARDALGCGADSALRSIPPSELSAEDVCRMAQRDPLSRRIMDTTGAYVGLALARAANVIAPEIIVVGGGVAESGEVLMAPLRAAFRRYIMPEVARGVRIVQSALGSRSGILGAAALAAVEAAT
jgi:glucokinase